MTTVTVKGKSIPFDEALQRARIAAMAGTTVDMRTMTVTELEARKRQIEHYKMLRKIDDITRREFCRAVLQ